MWRFPEGEQQKNDFYYFFDFYFNWSINKINTTEKSIYFKFFLKIFVGTIKNVFIKGKKWNFRDFLHVFQYIIL